MQVHKYHQRYIISSNVSVHCVCKFEYQLPPFVCWVCANTLSPGQNSNTTQYNSLSSRMTHAAPQLMEFCLLMEKLMPVCTTISPHLYRLCNYVLRRLRGNNAAWTGKSDIRTAGFPAAGKAYKAIGWPTPGAEYMREPLIALGFSREDLKSCTHHTPWQGMTCEPLPRTHNGQTEPKVAGLVFLPQLYSVEDGLNPSCVKPLPATVQVHLKDCPCTNCIGFTPCS